MLIALSMHPCEISGGHPIVGCYIGRRATCVAGGIYLLCSTTDSIPSVPPLVGRGYLLRPPIKGAHPPTSTSTMHALRSNPGSVTNTINPITAHVFVVIPSAIEMNTGLGRTPVPAAQCQQRGQHHLEKITVYSNSSR
ncbi:hypothetical protein THAOC_31774 [Thalassiosira oceanica]|uniref:Uncharacterized protein n=1 Tax=Thalassiosira oceanica TaxID=159749 RepID=K0RAL0_THAOC|nr:hypothetical protein THAOC_31774 [Thalassiosira oceanica]|eukprot:EJK49354.1 hypothetical protein THAOC_31774 [Thalassiosira oceanica]